MADMTGVNNLFGGLMQGFAQTSQQMKEQQMQKEHFDLMRKKAKLEIDMQEKKEQYLASHPELLPIAMGLQKPPDQMEQFLIKMLGGGLESDQPEMQGQQQAQTDPSKPLGYPAKTGANMGYQALAQSAADIYDVPLPLVMAVMQTESSFNPTAVSPKGAKGLMQMTTPALKDVGMLGADMFDPQQNITAGVKYLGLLLDRYGRTPEGIQQVIKAYNGGMGNLERGIIPAETKDYSQKVNGLLGGGQPSQAPSLTAFSKQDVQRGIMKKYLGVEQPKVFWEDNGNEFILRDEYGKVVGRQPRNVKKEKVEVDLPGGGKQTTWQDPFDPPVNPITTAPPKGETVTASGQMQNYQGGLEDAQKIVEAMMQPDGSIDQGTVFQTWGNIPKTKGRDLYSSWKNAVDAIVRSRTGAAVQKEEWEQYKQIYLPNPLDDQATQKAKLDRLIRDLSGTLEKADPSGTQRAREGQKPQEIEAPPISLLKEGFGTSFQDGSTWTLKGGKAVRVK